MAECEGPVIERFGARWRRPMLCNRRKRAVNDNFKPKQRQSMNFHAFSALLSNHVVIIYSNIERMWSRDMKIVRGVWNEPRVRLARTAHTTALCSSGYYYTVSSLVLGFKIEISEVFLTWAS